MELFLVILSFLALVALAAILNTQRKILSALKNLHIPEPPKPQKIEFPKVEFPKIEIPPAKEVVLDLNPVVEAVNNIRIPEPLQPQKIEFPKIEFPKIEIPPAKEVVLDLNPVIAAINSLQDKENVAFAQSDLIKALQETSALMRVNQAEFQSGLEAFHKAIDKMLAQIPNSEKELNTQKEFMQKFEESFVKVQESAAEAMNANSLRLQEILTEFVNK
ncbi:MAG: hypothetical protein FWC26_05185 [Fibromonadales bacterium]|nr:hypothetical protein [Fibromonadales bacterium]